MIAEKKAVTQMQRPVLSSIALSHGASAFIHSLSDQTESGAKCRVRGSALKLHWLSSSFQIRAFCGQTWLRLKLVSFQCENRQISRSESTFSFQSRHMHAPQRGVNGLCVDLSGVFRGCKQRDEELGYTLWVLSVVHEGF